MRMRRQRQLRIKVDVAATGYFWNLKRRTHGLAGTLTRSEPQTDESAPGAEQQNAQRASPVGRRELRLGCIPSPILDLKNAVGKPELMQLSSRRGWPAR